MKIAIACDHGGINLKQTVIDAVVKHGDSYVDYGTFNTESVDYPVYATLAARSIIDGVCDLGILICGTGIGMSIAANKIKGIRCGHVTTPDCARLTREHNNANMIALGGRITDETTAGEIVRAFLDAEFAGGRHARRVDMIKDIEENN